MHTRRRQKSKLMIKIILEVTESESGIGVELKSEDVAPSPQEKLFASQMAATITKFLNNAPKKNKERNN